MRFIDKKVDQHHFKLVQQELDRMRRTSNKQWEPTIQLRAKIRQVYNGCCAYCESEMEGASYYEIEHFYQKNKKEYKKHTFDYRNLHMSCQRCNNQKGKMNRLNILSPNFYLVKNIWCLTTPKKIEEELFYFGHLLFWKIKKEREINIGEETVKLFDLNGEKDIQVRSNRRSLVEVRLRKYAMMYRLLNTIYYLIEMKLKNKRKNIYNEDAIELLFESVFDLIDTSSAFSTMLLHNFGQEICTLLELLHHAERRNI